MTHTSTNRFANLLKPVGSRALAAIVTCVAALMLASLAPAQTINGAPVEDDGGNPLLKGAPSRFKAPPPSIRSPNQSALAPGNQQASDEAPPPIALDTEAWLAAKEILRAKADDRIWQLESRPGTQLLMLPIKVTAAKEAYELDLRTLKVRGGRFVAWMLLDPGESFPAGVEQPQLTDVNLPDEVPFVTRKVTVTPEGTLKWEMDRSIAGGSVMRSQNLYALRLDPAQMADKRPERPGVKRVVRATPITARRTTTRSATTQQRTSIGSAPSAPTRKTSEQLRAERDARRARKKSEADQRLRLRQQALADAAKNQDAEAKYRIEQAEYIELSREVIDLPDEFELTMPPYIWAVFEVRTLAKDLDVEGPPPLPWKIGMDQLEATRRLATGKISVARTANQEPQLPREVLADVLDLGELIKAQPHAYNLRLAASALAAAGLYQYASGSPELYALIEKLLHSDDSTARFVAVKALVKVAPPTTATTTLLKSATSQLDPATQLLALESQLKFDKNNPQQVKEMLDTANQFLADPHGPQPAVVLGKLLDTAKTQTNLVGALSTGVTFARLEGDRLDNAIRFVAGKAASDPIASAWVSHQLLGSSNTRIVLRTLQLLGGVEAAPAASVSVGGFLRALAPPPADSAAGTTLTLKAPIPVTSTDHGLFRALSHEDVQVRAAAWAALPAFAFVAPAPTKSPNDKPAPADPLAPTTDVYETLVVAALAQTPTPTQAADFLIKQSDRRRGGAGVVVLAIKGDSDAAARAVKALRGSGLPLDKVLLQQTFEDRYRLGVRAYQFETGTVPLVTGMLRERVADSAIVAWFGRELAAGRLPDSSLWSPAYGRNDRAIELIASTDEKLSLAAVAALVIAAGGSEQSALAVAERFNALSDRSIPNLQLTWLEARRAVHMDLVKHAAGPYRMVVRHLGAAPAADAATPSATPPAATTGSEGRPIISQIDVGLLVLEVDPKSITLGNRNVKLSVPDVSKLILRLDDPGLLKNIANNDLGKIAFDRLKQPIDLMPQGDGSWLAMANVPTTGPIDIVLLPSQRR